MRADFTRLLAAIAVVLGLLLPISPSNAFSYAEHPKTLTVMLRLTDYKPIVGGNDESEIHQNLAPALAAQLQTLFAQHLESPIKFLGSEAEWESAMANKYQNGIAFVTFSIELEKADEGRDVIFARYEFKRCISNTRCEIRSANPMKLDQRVWTDANLISSAIPAVSTILAKEIGKNSFRRFIWVTR
jgi:hypothetical protein